jgi:hypothetical protein
MTAYVIPSAVEGSAPRRSIRDPMAVVMLRASA